MHPRKTQHSNERVVSYIEFQSTLLRLMKFVHNNHLSTKAAFIKLKSHHHFFTPAENNQPRMMFTWPCHEENREITAMYSFINTTQKIEFFYQNEKFLTLSMNTQQGIEAFPHESISNKKIWNNEDIKELVETFNQVLQAKSIIYKSESQQEIVYDHRDHVTHFSKNAFQNIMSQYQHSNLTSRIENTIIKHAKRLGEKYSFYLDWPDSLRQNHSLKITFSRTDHFDKKYSWVIDEATMLDRFSNGTYDKIKPQQCYYSLSVKEVLKEPSAIKQTSLKRSHKKEIEILSFWLAVDGVVGELRDLKKGKNLSGNDVLAIYNYFDQLFQIKNTLICDESRLADEKDSVRVPLRLISSLCNGKTWYQNKFPGVKLFECSQFKSAHNGLITQCADTREQALKDLQQLRLSEWYEMLNEKGKVSLIKLFDTKSSGEKCTFDNATLQDLAILLFNDSKEKRVITPHLVAFTNLLCDGMNRDETLEPLKSQNDYWLKSRVKEILWGGYFWVKETITKPADHHTSPRIT